MSFELLPTSALFIERLHSIRDVEKSSGDSDQDRRHGHGFRALLLDNLHRLVQIVEARISIAVSRDDRLVLDADPRLGDVRFRLAGRRLTYEEIDTALASTGSRHIEPMPNDAGIEICLEDGTSRQKIPQHAETDDIRVILVALLVIASLLELLDHLVERRGHANSSRFASFARTGGRRRRPTYSLFPAPASDSGMGSRFSTEL